MDRQQATAPKEAFLNAPVIQRAPAQTPETFVPAAPSHVLNGVLAAAWAYMWLLPRAATGEPSEVVPTLIDGVAYSTSFLMLFAVLGLIGLAIKNSSKTAPVSIAIAAGTMAFVALCGIVGHPASTWLPDVAFAATVGAASVAVFARRA